MQVKPVAGAIGAVIQSADLAAPLDAATQAAIRAALVEHEVIFFTGQRLSPERLKAFAGGFGPLYVHPYAKALPGLPEVMPVVREADDRGRNFGGSWHTDLTFHATPPLGSVLYAVDVPDHGGDTMFASLSAAYDALSDGLKRTLAGLQAVHSARASYGPTTLAAARQMQLRAPDEIREATHPVVRRHPESGRLCLFVNRLSTIRFAGWSEDESRPLLDYLMRHAERPEFTCRFRWQSGSVAFWDNRAVQHFALNDYAGNRREMLRVTLEGDAPRGTA